MIWLFAIVTLIGIVALITSCICLTTDTNPFGLWRTICGISLVLIIIGGIGGSVCNYIEEKNTTQEECIEDEYQYNYCPYCGKELK